MKIKCPNCGKLVGWIVTDMPEIREINLYWKNVTFKIKIDKTKFEKSSVNCPYCGYRVKLW